MHYFLLVNYEQILEVYFITLQIKLHNRSHMNDRLVSLGEQID